jgi:hypothetical protein
MRLVSEREDRNMKTARIGMLLAIALYFVPALSPAHAFDYKDWIPLIPSELGGLKKNGKPEGMNMEMNNEKWSSLTQTYGDEDSDKETTLTIVCGTNAPQMQHFKGIPKMKMETEDQIMANVTVSGREGFLILDKGEKSGYLMILVDDRLLITLEMQDCGDKERLISAAKQIPFDKFRCSDK